MQVACQAPPSPPASAVLLAPPWHTRSLLALLLGVPSVSLAATSAGVLPPEPRAVDSYVPSVLVSVALAGFVSRFGLPSSILLRLLGRTWRTWRRAAGDVALAVSLTLLLLSLDAALVRVLAAPESLAAHWSRPATPAEHVGWVVFALSAGVGEELVYRGYLQQQLMVLSNSRALGVALQAFLFGIAHGEQGGAAVARFALYGALLGCLALLRGSVIPGVLAHVALDTYAGFAQ